MLEGKRTSRIVLTPTRFLNFAIIDVTPKMADQGWSELLSSFYHEPLRT